MTLKKVIMKKEKESVKVKRRVLSPVDFVYDVALHAKHYKRFFHPVTGEEMKPMSLTIPDESTSLKDLVAFAERNNTMPRVAPFGSYGNPDFDSPDLEKMKYMDEVDRGEAIDRLSEELERTRGTLNELEKKSIAAKKSLSDKMKAAMDKLDSLYERDPGKEEHEKPASA